MTSASFILGFSLTTRIINKLLQITKNKTKSNSIETLIFQVLIDLEIGYEEFITTVKEKKCIKNERKY